MRIRGFEYISKYNDSILKTPLPKRRTTNSAGYDIRAIEDVIIPINKLILISTGIKSYMQEDEYLGIHIRSSLAIKYNIILLNSQGIIDSDYYNNPTNEGHIMLPFFNMGKFNVLIKKFSRIAQGIFYKYLKTDNDVANKNRNGGFGSTGF